MNQTEKIKKIVWHYQQHIKTLTAPEGFKWLLWDLSHIVDKDAVKQVKQLIWKRAQAVGLDYDRKTKKFVRSTKNR